MKAQPFIEGAEETATKINKGLLLQKHEMKLFGGMLLQSHPLV